MRAFFSLVFVAVVITAWCPWFDMGEAKQLIAAKVQQNQKTLQTGCVLKIDPKTFQKVPFGFTETVAYNCTFNGDFLTEGKNTVFVFFFKEVVNVPHPIIK